jgi:uncharacterized protein YqjF (DUF2071 family)
MSLFVAREDSAVHRRSWILAMRWHDLAFFHWPVAPAALRPLMPSGLELDTFEGQAWVGVVPFRMTGVRARWGPSLPWLSAFPELNVRTYATAGGKPGVWFFSLDAGNPAAVRLARWTFGLPYYDARVSVTRMDNRVTYESVRTHRGGRPARFRGWYRPVGDVYRTRPGTLEDWLTARYCLYAADRTGVLYRGEIRHEPWPLQSAEAEIEVNTMASAADIGLPQTPPLVHFAGRLEVLAWRVRRV